MKHNKYNPFYINNEFSICGFDGAMMRHGQHKLVNMIIYLQQHSTILQSVAGFWMDLPQQMVLLS